ncbi:MAG: tetratricopeptide repeat protein [Spirochaetia bacterium]
MTMKKTLVALMVLLVATLAVAQQSDRELFNEAERRFQSQDYELAIDRYDTLIREFAVSRYLPDAQFRKAVGLYRLDRLDEALELLDLVERRYRSTRYLGYVPFWRGVVLYDQGSYEEALPALTAFVEATESGRPKSARQVDPDLENQALLYKALAEIATEQPESARASLVRLLANEAVPTDQPYALSLLMSLYVQAADYEAARTLYESVDSEALDAAYRGQISLYGAEALHGSGEADAAVKLYRALLNSIPQVVTVAYQRLFQYAQAELIPESSADILRRAEQALAGQTDILKELWLRVGIDSFNQSQFDLAELYFRRIWDSRPTEPIPASVPLYLSRLLDHRGDIPAAADVLTEYLGFQGEESDERLRVLIALGNFQIRTEEFEDAVTTLRSAVEDYPDSRYYGEAAYQYSFALRRTARLSDALLVIDAAFASGRTSGVQADLLRLRARILREQGREEDALQALFEYLPLRPADSDAALEYVNLLFELGRYERVLREGPNVLEELESRGVAGTLEKAQILYVLGLAHVSGKEYEEAGERFDAVLFLPSTSDPTVAGLLPYVRYYRGWSHYRLGDYQMAVDDFEAVVSVDAAHPLAPRSSYLAGWAYFRLARFDEATRALARVRTYAVSEQLTIEAGYLLGRSLASSGSLQQAAAEFRSLYLDYPDTQYADDAWFEYGQTQASLGNIDAAVAAFDELIAGYPSSELAEDAVLRRAEILYGASRDAEARDAYFAYRTLFPSGRQSDAALYWGGQASARLGETAGAILLWERLISEHRGSPYRADAMQEAAALHVDRGEYRQALNLYTELQATYAEIAGATGTQRRIDELVLLINGLSQREAELYVTIESSGGAVSDSGRQAIIELARLAIYEDTATGIDVSTVVPLLEAVADQASVAPAYAAQSLFLLGEYHSRQAEFLRAADRYLQAAATSSADRDLAALSIYRAAEMYSTAGRTIETQTLLQRLEEDFPGSQWLEEARGLQGGVQ